MSNKERLQKDQERRDRLLLQDVGNGMRQMLDSREGRALFWNLYHENIAFAPTHEEGPGRIAAARDMMRIAVHADFDGVQRMREEHERPGMRAEDLGEDETPDE